MRFLWLREDLRGQGHGRALLAAAEAEATRRDCGGVFLDSYSFQAPGFHERLGYETFAVLADLPLGHRRQFLRKVLIPAATDAPAVDIGARCSIVATVGGVDCLAGDGAPPADAVQEERA